MNSPQISVIVPVYNAEKYLRRCIDSILAQTFTDFELLLIDDGSKDQSGKICDEYADNDCRIKVFHKENAGVSSARNLGIEKSCAKWMIFIDSDDCFENNAFEILLDAAVRHSALIAAGNFWIIKDSEKKKFNNKSPSRIIENNYMELYFHCYSLRAGAALYSSKVLKECLFDTTLSRYEDAKHIYDVIRNVKIVYIPSCVMTYFADKVGGLSAKCKDVRKDFIFNMDFNDKSFWECMLLGRLLNQGYKLYGEYKDELDKIYRCNQWWRVFDWLMSHFHLRVVFRVIGKIG